MSITAGFTQYSITRRKTNISVGTSPDQLRLRTITPALLKVVIGKLTVNFQIDPSGLLIEGTLIASTF